MTLICAWCRREGKYGDLGEKEPLEDPSPTHGICARHEAQLLPALPRFAGVRGVQVILERRAGDRRREANAKADDRRRLQRRLRHGQVSSLGYTIVRFRRK